MASSSPLCQQNQNRPQQGLSRILKPHNEHCKTMGSTVQHGSKRGLENQDPSAPERGASTVNKLKGVSRLPVLAKTLQPSATSDPTQKKWEERPLLGKEKRKKRFTKPQPFNFSQPRGSRLETQKQEQASSGKTGKVRTLPACQSSQSHPAKTPSTLQPKPKTGNAVPGRTQPAGTSTYTRHLSTQSATPSGNTVSQCHSLPSRLGHGDSANHTVDSLSSVCCSTPESSSTDQTVTQSDVSKDISTHLGSISLTASKCVASAKDGGPSEAQSHKTPFRTPHSHAAPQRVAVKAKNQTAQPTPSVCKPDNTTDGFCPDPSALSRILQSEGVSASALQGTTPRPSGRGTSVYMPQRVPLLKSAQRKKTEANTEPPAFLPDPAALSSILRDEGIHPGGPLGGATPRTSVRPTSIYTAQRVPVSKPRNVGASVAKGSTVTFSPDPAALRSILQNEGIQAGGATPHTSACPPSGRGTSIYTAQRVPVTKSRTEKKLAKGPGRVSPRVTPVKYTPLRVASTKPQSTKRLLSAYRRTPKFSDSPGLKGAQTPSPVPPSQGEDDVVQRLFEEQDEEKMEDEEQQHAALQVAEHPESEAEVRPLVTHEAETADPQQGCAPAEQQGSRVPFIQAIQRESVIVLSSGVRLFGGTPARPPAPTPGDAQVPSVVHEPQCTSAQPVGLLPARPPLPTGLKGTVGLGPTPSKTKALCQKRVLELRAWGPTLEELLLDEECGTYMSQPQYCAAPPRCSDPVASTLLFQDSTPKPKPIMFGVSRAISCTHASVSPSERRGTVFSACPPDISSTLRTCSHA